MGAVACQGPEEYYRGTSETGAAGFQGPGAGGSIISGVGGDDTGAAGSNPTGVAGSNPTGVAGSSGLAGTNGAAGASPAGAAGTSGPAGTPGTAGASAAGAGGTSSGAAGAGRGGSTGLGGRAGSGGRAGGSGGRGGTTGTAGAPAGGAGGGSGPPPPAIQVVAKCQQANATQISIAFKILNQSNMSVPFSSITARYFYVLEDPDMTVPVVELDSVQSLAKTAIKTTPTATYVEFGFTTAAGALQAFDNINGTGEIQARFHTASYQPSNWNSSSTNDPSFMACSGSTFTPRTGFIAYVNGKQAWPAP